MKLKFKETYMDVAKRFAKLSHARRLQVGCVIVKDDIVHPGYNGMPAEFDNNCTKECMLPLFFGEET